MKESVGVGVVSRHAAKMRYGEPSQARPGSLFNGYRILYHQILRQESMEACGPCWDPIAETLYWFFSPLEPFIPRAVLLVLCNLRRLWVLAAIK